MKSLGSSLLIAFAVSTAQAADFSSHFIPGETLEYKISWMGLPLAWTRISTEAYMQDDRGLVRVRMVSRTYKAYKHIYKINDVIEVIIDPTTALPLRADVQINEGKRSKSHLTTFYHDQQMAIFQDRITKEIREIPIEPPMRDILSFTYSVRNQPLEELAAKEYRILVDGKIYDLGMKLHEDSEIALPAYGKVSCTEVEPIARFDGPFLRQGKIRFWVSKQKRPMVTCIHAKIPIGMIRAKLDKVSGPIDDFWAKPKE